MSPFIIYGLPRSRTYWLSRFLSYRDWNCGHDELRHVRSMEDVKAWFTQPCTGTVETGAAPWWRLVPPRARVVTVRRPVSEVVDSLARLGFDPAVMTPLMTKLDRKLDQIEHRVPGVLSVRFRDLGNEGTCRELFEYCLPYPHDPRWWDELSRVNLQTSMSGLVRYYQAYQSQLNKLAKIARHQIITAMARPVSIDGVTFQQEPFDRWYNEATPLFRDHMIATRQGVEDYTKKNIPLLRRLDELGFIQITTARSNGRMFGYILAVLCPSLDDPDVLSAMHLPFFASSALPGLGMKLQRASIEALRERGAREVLFRAGTRGSGPRLGAMYRRLGAEDFGQLFKLELKAA